MGATRASGYMAMKSSPEIIFHGIARSRWLEKEIARRVAHLERFAVDLVSCHVTLERSQSSHRTGNVYRVTVDVTLPPHKELVAKKEQVVEEMPAQLRALIGATFQAMERQLKKTVQRRRRDVKRHAPARARRERRT